jgi:hypothetical protein
VSQSISTRTGGRWFKKLLTTSECEAVAALYADDRHFRSHIVMARHGFGRGEYKYFTYPLPDTVADLRTALYPRLAPIANLWNASMGIAVPYPDAHADFIARCLVPLRRGDGVVFAVHNRPVQGTRGTYRVNLRHGVSRLRSGHRHTVGVIFHDAK